MQRVGPSGRARLRTVSRVVREQALAGLAAGLMGALSAGVLAYVVLSRALDTPWVFSLLPFVSGIGLIVLLSTACGLVAGARALAAPPAAILRAEEG